jgi:DNA-binding NarL/FixJ family response regulator
MASRILIVDDHEVVRIGVRILLAGNPKLEVCGEAADGRQALREVVKLVPDVVLLDLSLPEMNGFEVAKEIRRITPSTKIVLFSIHDVPATARHIGIDAFVGKSSGSEELMNTLERVVQPTAADA